MPNKRKARCISATKPGAVHSQVRAGSDEIEEIRRAIMRGVSAEEIKRRYKIHGLQIATLLADPLPAFKESKAYRCRSCERNVITKPCIACTINMAEFRKDWEQQDV